MEPLSVASSVVGVTPPALHCVRHLLDDIQKIIDAPEAVASLRGDLTATDKALISLQTITDSQWKSLGDIVIDESKSAMTLCLSSCERFQTALARWTQHSHNGKLSWRDRAVVGFFKQKQIKSMSEQLQICKTTLTSVVSIATLHSSLQQKDVSDDLLNMISLKEAEVTTALEAANKQLVEVNTQLAALRVAGQRGGETEADRADVDGQVVDELSALDTSRRLLEALLERTHAAVAEAQKEDDGPRFVFGNVEKGFQIGTNSGTISGITFN
ncbi:hypothetical protein C8A01DRAFT_21371 [Parachaetomium inaequale]|uniref:Azaphilone pigments biosynthesis cluster protein L N-terminal domain-containing protein n=1 Tax=Parachaetomium inaequale TaxID=2588326 RepID=A0AAN6P449_9PEZI|nr:hypothetical protein C8A01DRAFT_21371 [Parachaetomium inaequale]